MGLLRRLPVKPPQKPSQTRTQKSDGQFHVAFKKPIFRLSGGRFPFIGSHRRQPFPGAHPASRSPSGIGSA